MASVFTGHMSLLSPKQQCQNSNETVAIIAVVLIGNLKGSFPILITECCAQTWSRCTGSQLTGDKAIHPAVGFCHLHSVHQMAPPEHGCTQPIPAYYSFIDRERMKGW